MKEQRVQLDLNNPEFQESCLRLDKPERNRVTDTLKKLKGLTWDQVCRDQSLKWEKIASVKLPQGIPAIYSLRITQSSRAVAFRDGDVLRMLIVAADHDAAYGKQ